MLPFTANPFKGTPLESHASRALDRSPSSGSTAFNVLERILASLMHVASRGLIYVGVKTSDPLPVAPAVAAFAAIVLPC